ncbi:MAG: homocysteine S-methyltransferase [Flavobacteriales bacterium]|nr:homocysteine S-methyltransferase [Flavobacteriales bacterium]
MEEISFPLLLDGGLSNELEKQGHHLNDKLWSARLLKDNPRAIVDAHLAYLRSGAQILVTASYQASVTGLVENLNLSEEEAQHLMEHSVQLANEAIELYQKESGDFSKKYVAASIGPYGAYLADGSEYHGDYRISDEALYIFHKEKLDILSKTNADFLACETIPSFREAKVLSHLLDRYSILSWVSFSCKDEFRLNDGSDLRLVSQLFESCKNVFALGINCTPPQYIQNLIQLLKSIGHQKKIIVYPNSGELYDTQNKSWSGNNNPIMSAKLSTEWLDSGVDIIGGCCRIGPPHIAAIKNTIDSRQ